MWGYPAGTPIEEWQSRIEWARRIEDLELRERIAAERFAEHEGSDDDRPENDSNRNAD